MGKQILVFRVEDKDNNGYKDNLDSNISNWTQEGVYDLALNEDETLYGKQRPLPEDDNIPEDIIKDFHFFGFKNLKQLNRWFFPADLVMGNLFGGKISLYSVHINDVVYGNNQLIFNKRKSIKIKEYPLNNFLPYYLKNSTFDFKNEIESAIDIDFDIPNCLSHLKN